MGQNLNANEPAVEDVEAHGLLRNAAVATALAVGGGGLAMAAPASAEGACVTTTDTVCAETGDEVYVEDLKADSLDETVEMFAIRLMRMGAKKSPSY